MGDKNDPKNKVKNVVEQINQAKAGNLGGLIGLVFVVLAAVYWVLSLLFTVPVDKLLWGTIGGLLISVGVYLVLKWKSKLLNVVGGLLIFAGIALVLFKATNINFAPPTEEPAPELAVFSDGGFTHDGQDKFSYTCYADIRTKKSQLNVIENQDYFDDTRCIISPKPEIVADDCSSCALQDYDISNVSMTIIPTSFGPSANSSSTPAFGFWIQCDDDDERPDYAIMLNKPGDYYSARYYFWVDQWKSPQVSPIGQVKADDIKDLTLSLAMDYSSLLDVDSKTPQVPVEITFEDQVNSTLSICAFPKSISFGPWVDSKDGVYDSMDILVDRIEYTGVPKLTPVP